MGAKSSGLSTGSNPSAINITNKAVGLTNNVRNIGASGSNGPTNA